jgi:cytidylate kinase
MGYHTFVNLAFMTQKLQMSDKINIAIDGHSSCGKSTLAKDLARALGYRYIDSGAMYRAVTLYFLENGITVDNDKKIAEALKNINIELQYPEGQFQIFLNGREITSRIKQMDVSSYVSEVAAVPAVRRKLVEIQRQLGQHKGVVMDGRDIASVVFPDAELKIFVTAELDIRTERRFNELKNKSLQIQKSEVKENLIHRDYIDSNREDSPLIQTEDAILLDNSYLNREEQLTKVLKLIEAMNK